MTTFGTFDSDCQRLFSDSIPLALTVKDKAVLNALTVPNSESCYTNANVVGAKF